jgi:hypothetical protein
MTTNKQKGVQNLVKIITLSALTAVGGCGLLRAEELNTPKLAPTAIVSNNNTCISEQPNPATLNKKDNYDAVCLSISSTLLSRDVRPYGNIIGKGPVDQTYLGLEINRNFAVSAWIDYNIKDRDLDEVDYSFESHTQSASIREGPFKGKISGSIDIEEWRYPSGKIFKHDNQVLDAGLSYKGVINANLLYSHLVTHGFMWDGNRVRLTLSKRLDLNSTSHEGLKVYLLPNFAVARSQDFSPKDHASQATPKVSFGAQKGPFSAEVFIARQFVNRFYKGRNFLRG